MTLSLNVLFDERDLGTPPADRRRVAAPDTVEVTIDGQTVTVPEGTSVMRWLRSEEWGSARSRR